MYTDDNGIVRFEALDNVAPLQVGLNTALESVSGLFDAQSLDQRLADILDLVDSETKVKILELIGDVSQKQFPFRLAAGLLTYPQIVGNGGIETITVTLPAERFTQRPAFAVLPTSPRVTPSFHSGSETEITVRLANWTGSNAPSASANWLAVEA